MTDMSNKLDIKKRIMALVMALAAFATILGTLFSSAFASASAAATVYALTNLTFTGILLAVVGLIIIIVAILPVFGSRVRIVIGIIGVVMLLVGVVYFVQPTTTITTQVVTPAITIESVAGGSYQYTAATHTLVVPITQNVTSKTITSPTGGKIWFNFTVGRTDTNTSAAVFALTSNWATLTNSTTGTASSVVIKNANGTYELHFGAQWGENALVSVAAAGTTVVSVEITLNAAATLDLVQYGQTDIGINIGGQSITVEALVATQTH